MARIHRHGLCIQVQQVGWVTVRKMLVGGVARRVARKVAKAIWPGAEEGTRVAYDPVVRELAKKSYTDLERGVGRSLVSNGC